MVCTMHLTPTTSEQCGIIPTYGSGLIFTRGVLQVIIISVCPFYCPRGLEKPLDRDVQRDCCMLSRICVYNQRRTER